MRADRLILPSLWDVAVTVDPNDVSLMELSGGGAGNGGP